MATEKVKISKQQVKRHKKKDRVFRPSPREHNFLKYWRIVRYWAKRRYDITDIELEVLLYLYDIPLFTISQFKEFEGILNWDKKRMQHFVRKGYITEWRGSRPSKEAKLFTLTQKAKLICSSIYKKLLQEERIPETAQNNPIFVGKDYMDKVYRTAIKRMNKARDERIRKAKEAELGI